MGLCKNHHGHFPGVICITASVCPIAAVSSSAIICFTRFRMGAVDHEGDHSKVAKHAPERRLAAILAGDADVVGYSKLMGQDETGSLTSLKSATSTGSRPRSHKKRRLH